MDIYSPRQNGIFRFPILKFYQPASQYFHFIKQ